MSELNTELAKLDLDGLDLDTLDIQDMELMTNKGGLEALTLGHGMIELGASIWPKLRSDLSFCCSCPCCCA
jgi:hypothetical protein